MLGKMLLQMRDLNLLPLTQDQEPSEGWGIFGANKFLQLFGGLGTERRKVPARSYEATGDRKKPWESPAMGTGSQKYIQAERTSSLTQR